MARNDHKKFQPFDTVFDTWLPSHPRPHANPWSHVKGSADASYEPHVDLLAELLKVPVRSKASTQGGAYPAGLDLWLAHEFSEAGFVNVWPRSKRPRVISADVETLIWEMRDSGAAEHEIWAAALKSALVTPHEAHVLGRASRKQVDVLMSTWERGPELMVSTKTQLSSFSNNKGNRFEEAYGDAANLGARHPLSAIGFVFLVHASIPPKYLHNVVDMVRKLRKIDGADGYTSTCLVMADWKPGKPGSVRIDPGGPAADDVSLATFMKEMCERVLETSMPSDHERARRLHDGR